jgi:hypothetical protein
VHSDLLSKSIEWKEDERNFAVEKPDRYYLPD